MLRHTHLRATALGAVLALGSTLAACGGDDHTASTPVTHDPVVVTPVATEPEPTPRFVVSPDVTYEQSESTFTARRYEEATEMFAVYVGRRPDNPWGHYMLGLSAWKSGQLERARVAFEDALALDPSHVKSLVNLSRVLLDDGKPNDALARIRQAVALDSINGDAYRVLGRVHGSLGHTEEAIDAYRTALALDPDDTWSMNNMGLVLIQAGRYEEALAPLARAVQIDEQRVPQFRNNLGIALERTGRFAKAESLFREALSLDSGYTKAAVSLARVEGRSDARGVSPVEISTLGDGFATSVLEWRVARGLTEDTGEVADTVSVEQRVSKVDSTQTPR